LGKNSTSPKESHAATDKKQNAQLTRIDRRTFEGLEASVENCGGYSMLSAIANYTLRKVSIAHKIKTTKAGGTRYVPWHERTCNNSWLSNPDYFALKDEFQAVDGRDPNASVGPFKSEKQYGAYIAEKAGFQQSIAGIAACTASAVIPSGELIEKIPQAGLFGAGIYLAVGGLTKVAQAMRVQHQESRQEGQQ
jgi:hypothetical protein